MSACICINLLTVLGIFLNVTFVKCSAEFFTFWPLRIVPYTIGKGFNSNQVSQIKRDVNQFNTKTCVQWLEADACPGRTREVEFVHIDSGSCTYGTGDYNEEKKRFIHYINLTNLCFGNHWVTHEMMHVMGIKNEQSRIDRNCYVKVDLDAVGSDPDYAIVHDSGWMEGFPYDIHSVMHFHRDSRMRIKDEGFFETVDLGQTTGILTPLDLLKFLYVYCGGPHYCEWHPAKCVEMDKSEKDAGCV